MIVDGPITVARPGLGERLAVVAMLFVLGFGLPADWLATKGADATQAVVDARSEGGDLLITFVILLFAGVAASRLVGNFRFLFRLVEYEVLLPAFLGWMTFSYVWSNDPSLTFRRSFALLVVAFYGYYLVVRFDLREILRMCATAAVFGTVLNLVFGFALSQYGHNSDGQWVGVFTNRNELGRMAAFCALIFLLAARDHRRFRVLMYSMLLANVLLVVRSESKTSLATLVLLAGLLAVFTGFRGRKTLYGAVAVSLISASVVALLWATANLDFVTDLLDRDVTLTGRTELWAQVVESIREEPVLGYGYQGFWGGLFSPSHELIVTYNWAPNAHNALLEYALAGGIPAALLFLALWFRTTARSARYVRYRPVAVGLLPLGVSSFVLLSSITESGIVARSLPFLMFVAVIASVTKVRRPRAPEEAIRQDLARELTPA
jgi:O-antigen ligase